MKLAHGLIDRGPKPQVTKQFWKQTVKTHQSPNDYSPCPQDFYTVLNSPSLKRIDPGYFIWSDHYIQENHASLLAFYMPYLLIFTTSCICNCSHLSGRNDMLKLSLPPYRWCFPPSCPPVPHLGDTLEPLDTQTTDPTLAWWSTVTLLIRFSLGLRRKRSLTLMHLLSIERIPRRGFKLLERTASGKFKWNYWQWNSGQSSAQASGNTALYPSWLQGPNGAWQTVGESCLWHQWYPWYLLLVRPQGPLLFLCHHASQ